jgi:hypothetical protein
MNKLLYAIVAASLLSACDKPAPAPVAPAAETAAADSSSSATPAAEPSPPAASETAAAIPESAAPASVAATDTAGDKATDDAIDSNLGDHTRYRDVIDRFQKAVADKDAKAVAALIQYPFGATIDGKTKVIKDSAGFVANYGKIVTPPIADVIVKQKYADLFVNYKGVMFGSGEVWINGICKDNACKAFDVKVVTIQSGA